MADKTENAKPAFEFWLVIAMLISLVILVVLVLAIPISIPGNIPSNDSIKFTDILDYRKGILVSRQTSNAG
jgi:hypothetical protein